MAIDKQITRPALRYFGAKFRIADKIIAHFPPHRVYVEPFGGAAGVLLRKKPSYLEVYNDKEEEVVNFFKVLRDHSQDLERAIRLTPYSRYEFDLSHHAAEESLERARRMYVRCWQSFSAKTKHKSGWRIQTSESRGGSVVDDWNRTDDLCLMTKRFKDVQIENDDAIRVIKRYDNPKTLFYIDPPYLAETRSKHWSKGAYVFEMTKEQHAELLETLLEVAGMVILSGYKNTLYDEQLSDWEHRTIRTQTNARKSVLEHLWLSPRAIKAHPQGELFQMEGT